MTQYLNTQLNLSALQVPGVSVDIITPKPNLLGVPTNVVGLVGVGQWGPLNSLIAVSQPSDCALSVGSPVVRNYDIASHVWAATQVGGAIAFNCVRVSDGTDTAATLTVQSTCLTITGKYTGTLGNLIKYQAQAGTMAGTYAFIIYFPGSAPQYFNNIGMGIGSIATTAGTGYTSVPTASTTAAPTGVIGNRNAIVNPALSIIGTPTITGGGGGNGYLNGDILNLPGGVILSVLSESGGVISTVTVVSRGQITSGTAPTTAVPVSSTSGGGTGATFTLLWGIGAPVIQDPGQGYLVAPTISLTGGGGTLGAYTASLSVWLNAANTINNGNAFSGPSPSVVATAGTGTALPTLATPLSLSGGTDGSANVSDTTLVGNDGITRTGMYALRSSNVDTFTLIDQSTPSMWPAIDSFALSESCLAVQSTPSGTSMATTIADRTSVGLDDFFFWLLTGDWTSFYDSQNQVTRLINPTAFAVGLVGNLSPQYSPLNKVLRGVTSTQTTASAQSYSDATLAIAETGGIDLIVGPPTTPGGQYYTFITGRNASSNTAANGVEWTRLTNFLSRTAQTSAAGSFIGQLQSIQNNDPTRQAATDLFNGLSAQLAAPQSGPGSLGMIDAWSVQCTLANNPPNLQALGYLFLYWQVRYLNTVRFFIVQLAGGGNVVVTSQSTPPTPAQFLSNQ